VSENKTIDNLESYFKDMNGLNDLVTKTQPLFDQVDELGRTLRQGEVNTSMVASECLLKATGLFVYINKVSVMLGAYKKNTELRDYVARQTKASEAGTKFTASGLEKESSAAVAEWRRARDIYVAYSESCRQIIQSLQSYMKYLNDQKMMSPEA
jgi:hypothetical protein